jgi:hypothetical protein
MRTLSVDPCCIDMAIVLNQSCDDHSDPFECPDALIIESKSNRLGLTIIVTDGHSFVEINYCPWCGTELR